MGNELKRSRGEGGWEGLETISGKTSDGNVCW